MKKKIKKIVYIIDKFIQMGQSCSRRLIYIINFYSNNNIIEIDYSDEILIAYLDTPEGEMLKQLFKNLEEYNKLVIQQSDNQIQTEQPISKPLAHQSVTNQPTQSIAEVVSAN